MTALELENTLMELGCNSFSGNEFSHIGTLALRRIYNDLPITKRGGIYAHGLQPSTVRTGIYHKAGNNTSYPLMGKAFSVRVCGASPRILVNTGTTTTSTVFPDGTNTLKGFIVDNMGIISFVGDHDYYIENLCLYDQVYTTDIGEIPEGGDFAVYDARKYIKDFISFASPPCDYNGNPINDAKLSGTKITVKSDYRGEIFFDYRKGPLADIDYDTREEIDIPDEYQNLLVILFLAYHFAEVDVSRSKYYMEQYEGLLKSILARQSTDYTEPQVINLSGSYTICDGWA